MNTKLREDYTPAALYARVSSDRQDVDLSIAATAPGAQGLRREERLPGSARVRRRGRERAHRRQTAVPKDAGRRRQTQRSLPGDSCMEVLALHTQAGTRRRLQVHAS